MLLHLKNIFYRLFREVFKMSKASWTPGLKSFWLTPIFLLWQAVSYKLLH